MKNICNSWSFFMCSHDFFVFVNDYQIYSWFLNYSHETSRNHSFFREILSIKNLTFVFNKSLVKKLWYYWGFNRLDTTFYSYLNSGAFTAKLVLKVRLSKLKIFCQKLNPKWSPGSPTKNLDHLSSSCLNDSGISVWYRRWVTPIEGSIKNLSFNSLKW